MGMEATINREAAEAPAGCGGVLFLPYFQGRGSPDWNPAMPGGFLGISLGSGRGQLARAILEGIALEIAENVQLLRKAVPAARQITVGGGLTKSPLFVQILADALGEPLRLCPTGENTALGAFFSGAAALGLYEGPAQAAQALGRQGPKTEPNLTRHSLYQAALCRRQRICEALK